MLIGGRVALDGGFVSLIPLGRAVAREGVRLAANRPPGGCRRLLGQVQAVVADAAGVSAPWRIGDPEPQRDPVAMVR